MANDSALWSIRSVLISVSDLDQSTTFYEAVLNVHEIFREDQMAVLSGNETGLFSLYLRQALRNASRPGQNTLGVRSLSCDVGSLDELDRLEGRLRDLGSFRDRQRIHESEKFDVVFGRDPDRLPLVFVAYDSDSELSIADYHRAITAMYAVDL